MLQSEHVGFVDVMIANMVLNKLGKMFTRHPHEKYARLFIHRQYKLNLTLNAEETCRGKYSLINCNISWVPR
jgi:hypothetical protein